jgi:hypothetical protein
MLIYGCQSKYLACQNKKDVHGGIARLQKSRRSVRQLRCVLQAAERLPVPEINAG